MRSRRRSTWPPLAWRKRASRRRAILGASLRRDGSRWRRVLAATELREAGIVAARRAVPGHALCWRPRLRLHGTARARKPGFLLLHWVEMTPGELIAAACPAGAVVRWRRQRQLWAGRRETTAANGGGGGGAGGGGEAMHHAGQVSGRPAGWLSTNAGMRRCALVTAAGRRHAPRGLGILRTALLCALQASNEVCQQQWPTGATAHSSVCFQVQIAISSLSHPTLHLFGCGCVL